MAPLKVRVSAPSSDPKAVYPELPGGLKHVDFGLTRSLFSKVQGNVDYTGTGDVRVGFASGVDNDPNVTKLMERAVLDYHASLWNAKWPNNEADGETYWGSIFDSAIKSNLYALWSAKEYLSGKIPHKEVDSSGNTRQAPAPNHKEMRGKVEKRYSQSTHDHRHEAPDYESHVSSYSEDHGRSGPFHSSGGAAHHFTPKPDMMSGFPASRPGQFTRDNRGVHHQAPNADHLFNEKTRYSPVPRFFSENTHISFEKSAAIGQQDDSEDDNEYGVESGHLPTEENNYSPTSSPVLFYSSDTHTSYVKSAAMLQLRQASESGNEKYMNERPVTGDNRQVHYQGQNAEHLSNFYAVRFYSGDFHTSLAKSAALMGLRDVSEVGNEKYMNECPVTEDGVWPSTASTKDILVMADYFAARGHPVIVSLNYGSGLKGAYDDVKVVHDGLKEIFERYANLFRPIQLEKGLLHRTGFWIHVDGTLGSEYMPYINMAFENDFKHKDGTPVVPGPDINFEFVHSLTTYIDSTSCAIYMTKNKYLMTLPSAAVSRNNPVNISHSSPQLPGFFSWDTDSVSELDNPAITRTHIGGIDTSKSHHHVTSSDYYPNPGQLPGVFSWDSMESGQDIPGTRTGLGQIDTSRSHNFNQAGVPYKHTIYDESGKETSLFAAEGDTSATGSRNHGRSVALLWTSISSSTLEDKVNKAVLSQELAMYMEKSLKELEKELDIDMWVERSPPGMTVCLRRLNDELAHKYSLSSGSLNVGGKPRLYSAAATMDSEHVTTGIVDRFIEDIRKQGEAAFTKDEADFVESTYIFEDE